MEDRFLTNRTIGGIQLQHKDGQDVAFQTFKELLHYQLSDELFGVDESGNPKPHEIFNPDNPDYVFHDENGVLTPPMLKKKNRDTSLGGNDAINCEWQFCEHDDIIHQIHAIGEDRKLGLGMGRVFSEVFDDKQKIMYLTFGVPEYTSLLGFFGNIIDANMASLANSGDFSIIKGIFRGIGNVAGAVLILPILPFKIINNLFSWAFSTPATKYFDFRATMPLYYKTVNTMLAHLAVNLGLSDMVDKHAHDKLLADQDARSKEGAAPSDPPLLGLPSVFQLHGTDILSILSKKDFYDGITNRYLDLNDEITKLMDREDEDPITGTEDEEELKRKLISQRLFDDYTTGFVSGALGALFDSMHFIGFKIDKTVDSSESASNSTDELPIASSINQRVKSGRSAAASLMGGSFDGGILDATIGTALKGAMSVLSGMASTFSLGTTVTEVMKGSGYVDIGEMWSNSSFSKSYSFSFQLRAPAADILSQFYYLYVPLCLLLAGAFPRAVGKAAYTSPFVIRAFCKGLFAVPMGIVDSITIKRGDAEFGWSINNLPTCIDITFSIKDLSPIMYVPVADGMNFASILGQNSSYQEYLLTLSGSDMKQRILGTRRFWRNIKTFLKISKANKLNPAMWGMSLANNTFIGRTLYMFTPVSKIPDNITQ